MSSIRTEPLSPIVHVYDKLRMLHPNWYVEFGMRSGDGWIPGPALRNPAEGSFGDLLGRIAARLKTNDRKIVAGSFALRFGWASGVAVAPFLLHQCVLIFDWTIGTAGVGFRGHQFRYSRLNILSARIEPALTIRRRREGAWLEEEFQTRNTIASYIHAHWASNPALARILVDTAAHAAAGKGV